MIYLTGPTNDRIESQLISAGVGLMVTPRNGISNRVSRYHYWAADNGCFSQGNSFDPDKWLRWLSTMAEHAGTCLFAVAPDVVGDASATIERSAPYLQIIREMGYPAAFVAQDGQEEIPVPWDDFDWLFVGGTTEFKLSEGAYQLVHEALHLGKFCHMGRVNGWRRFKAAWLSGYHSADGTYIAFNPQELTNRVADWMKLQEVQPPLPLWEGRPADER